ncbi:MAG: aspartate ammonia-lyase [Candidatus Aenigmarchaeota archaeon]|nr:aspartate ammonia-lyase [Candidatus Aenigmarchaeota archaeon]
MNNAKSIPKALIGISGTHFVAGELTRRGYIATITSRNTKGIDILVSDSGGKKPIAIQVKATLGKNSPRAWILSENDEVVKSDNLFYVFVNLDEAKRGRLPEFFVVPCKNVSKYTKTEHAEWKNKPGKTGKKHNKTSIRMFRDKEGKYLNRWDLLGLKRQ